MRADASEGQGAVPMQLHSDWLARRPRGLALVAQYLKSALRPTVALPYPLLIGLIAFGGF